MYFGKRLTTGVHCRFDAFGLISNARFNSEKPGNYKIVFGDDVQINDFVHITAVDSVIIGNNVLIASRVFITDHNHGNFPFEPEFSMPVARRSLSSKQVILEHNAWIGEGVCILPGVKVGENSIIGANSVVTGDVPPNCIAVGSPARVIKEFNFFKQKWVPAELDPLEK